MVNNFFSFKQFIIYQDRSAFKVGTDGVLLGACTDISIANKILDIGAGTGLITIMLAQRSNAEIVAIEPDYDSYIQACENVTLCKWRTRIKVRNCDLQNYFPGHEKFDLIVTNAPYFTNSLKNPDSRKTFSRHNDSLTQKELLSGTIRLLEDNGKFQIIMPYAEGSVFIAEAQQWGLYCNSILKIKPVPSSEVTRLILGFSRKKEKVTERFLTIERGRRHEFTEEYVNLTKDFYLKF